MNTKRQPRILIAGNGGAAAHAIMAARGVGFEGEIHLVSDTESPAFNPMLAPYYLKGVLSWRQCFPFGSDFYRTHHVACHFGAAVEHLDPRNKSVLLRNKKRLPYDKCLIATGASAILPPVPGLQDSPYAFPLRTADSAMRIQQAMTSAKRVIVLGASLVGVKVAEILSKRDVKVVLLDVASQMLPRGAHPQTAALLKSYFENHGVEVRIGCGLEGMDEGNEGVCCFLPNHIMEEADFVAVCAGIRPNLQFVDRTEVDIEQAILVDGGMQTSVKDLYAAGDVCQGLNRLTGKREWLGTWRNACYQGRIAGLNMAGRTTCYAGAIPQHVSPFFDWTYAQIGDVDRRGEHIRTDISGAPENDGGYRLLVYEKEVLVGANFINTLNEIGPAGKAIARKTSWHPQQPLLELYH
jgi:NADPH-dependent 2,4-dienoyl-CoA reductase/sulfur reductase-like enzyme